MYFSSSHAFERTGLGAALINTAFLVSYVFSIGEAGGCLDAGTNPIVSPS